MLSVKNQNKMVNLEDTKYMLLFLKSLNPHTMIWIDGKFIVASIDGVDITADLDNEQYDTVMSRDMLLNKLNAISKPHSLLNERFLGFKRLLEEQVYDLVNDSVYINKDHYTFFYNGEVYSTVNISKDLRTDVYIRNKGNFDQAAASMYAIKEYIAEGIVQGSIEPLSTEPKIFFPSEVMDVIKPVLTKLEDYEENGKLVFRFELVGARTVHYSIDISFSNKVAFPEGDALMERIGVIVKQCTHAYYARRECNMNKNLF